MRYFLLLSLFVTLNAQAIDTDKAAHLGIAYMATTLSYGAFKTMGVDNKLVGSLFAGTLVGMVSTMKELTDKKEKLDEIDRERGDDWDLIPKLPPEPETPEAPRSRLSVIRTACPCRQQCWRVTAHRRVHHPSATARAT